MFLTAENPAGGLMQPSFILMMLVMVAVFYFFMIRPENKKKKEAEELRNSISTGDKITTIGGIVGTVVNVKEDKIVIETSADQVRLELCKWAVSTNDTANERIKAEQAKKNEEKAKAKAAKKAGKEKK